MSTPKYINPEIHPATTKEDKQKCIDVRVKVCTDELKLPIEYQTQNADDAICDHWLATAEEKDGERVPVGTIRLLRLNERVGQLGRLAVLSDARGLQLGKKLVYAMLEGAKAHGFKEVYLEAQSDKRAFYEKFGWVVEEADKETFITAGVPHYKMWMRSIPQEKLI
ncbi:acyl-CoA N-acyltransferase [Phascolomyces articulosus]|uniref:Glucosamine 6-phosphate N-acetyltransferase n=1 Tax=Phascolomyces articulosus TaxID=60185 RepID=A0AAD5K079_9FUNG|nr:acyl-CoA N-acyltransferase [Phascolomyces articulosus]